MKTIVSNVCTKALVAVALTCAALSGSADLIYWTVDNAVGDINSGKEGSSMPFYYATISADGTRLNMYDESGNTGYSKLYAENRPSASTGLATYAGSFTYGDVTSFLVELWNDDGSRVGWQSYSASSVASSIWRGDSPSQSGATALVVSAVVPEPTSGMLLVLGGALLALRRRRSILA